MAFHFHSGLWLAAQFLQAGILVALFKRQWLPRYRWFATYIMLQMVSEPFLALAADRWPYTYYFGYWLTVVAEIILMVAVLLEVVGHVWRPGNARGKFRNALLWGLVLASLIMELPVLATSSSNHMDAITSLILCAELNTQWAICGVGLFLLLFATQLGLSLRELDFGVVAGFVLLCAMRLSVVTLLSHTTAHSRSTLSAINSGAYLLATLIWLAYAVLSPKDLRGGSAGTPPAPHEWPGGVAFMGLRWDFDSLGRRWLGFN